MDRVVIFPYMKVNLHPFYLVDLGVSGVVRCQPFRPENSFVNFKIAVREFFGIQSRVKCI